MYKIIFVLTFFLILENTSYAYLGPGIGGGLIAATLGIIIAIFAALFGILWFPIKRFLKKRKKEKNSDNRDKPD